MATESFGLYANQSVEESVSPEMRVNVFRVIFDILLLYGTDFLEEKGYNVRYVILTERSSIHLGLL